MMSAPAPIASREAFAEPIDLTVNPASPAVLIVENDPDEVLFFRGLLRKAGADNPLRFASDGAEAIALLANAVGETRPAHTFRLMFLDLRMPRQNGFDVLNWVRRLRSFDRLIIAILSTAADDRDVMRAYDMGAQTFLTKYPSVAILRQILTTIAQLPPGTPASSVKLPGLRPNFRFPADDYTQLLHLARRGDSNDREKPEHAFHRCDPDPFPADRNAIGSHPPAFVGGSNPAVERRVIPREKRLPKAAGVFSI